MQGTEGTEKKRRKNLKKTTHRNNSAQLPQSYLAKWHTRHTAMRQRIQTVDNQMGRGAFVEEKNFFQKKNGKSKKKNDFFG